VNGEVANVVSDYGTCLFANGQICAGHRQPGPSRSIPAPVSTMANRICSFLSASKVRARSVSTLTAAWRAHPPAARNR